VRFGGIILGVDVAGWGCAGCILEWLLGDVKGMVPIGRRAGVLGRLA
jgi:hypothetical protein